MSADRLKHTGQLQNMGDILQEHILAGKPVLPSDDSHKTPLIDRVRQHQSQGAGPKVIIPYAVVSGEPNTENIQSAEVSNFAETPEATPVNLSSVISENPIARLRNAAEVRNATAPIVFSETALKPIESTQTEMFSDTINNMEDPKIETNKPNQVNEEPNKHLETPEEAQTSATPPQSRRKFSKIGVAGAGLLAIATAFGTGYVSKGKLPELSFGNTISGEQNPNPGEMDPNLSGKMTLAENERVFQQEMLGYMSWTPDGPITYWTTTEGKKRYLLTGGNDNATYMLETDGSKTLKDIMASGGINENSFIKVYGPDQNVEYRRQYAGITGVLQIDKNNPDHLLGIAHCEERTSRDASGDYTSTVGLTESFDGGLTWEDKGALITGTDVKEPGGGRVSGAGQPTVLVKDGFAYIMYIDWSAKGEHPDQLYMARAKANDNGSLGQIEYYTENGFSMDKKSLKSVIPVPENSNLVYTALPHVSWNKDSNLFTVEGESDNGFWRSASNDLLNWTEPEIVYDFTTWGGKPHSILNAGEKWDSYPTALSESEPNSQITTRNGIFYHSSGDNLSPHEPAAVDFEIK